MENLTTTTPPPEIIEAALKVERYMESQCAKPGQPWSLRGIQSRDAGDSILKGWVIKVDELQQERDELAELLAWACGALEDAEQFVPPVWKAQNKKLARWWERRKAGQVSAGRKIV